MSRPSSVLGSTGAASQPERSATVASNEGIASPPSSSKPIRSGEEAGPQAKSPAS